MVSAVSCLLLAGFDRQPGIEFHVYPARLIQLCLGDSCTGQVGAGLFDGHVDAAQVGAG